MLREFSKSSAATTLLEAFVASTATNVAILDSQGKEIFALGSLPFLCQIIHNKDARVCPDTCRLHESHPRFECHGGLMTLSAPLLVNNERAGTLVARGLRTNSSTPKLTSIAEQIGVEEGELVDEFQRIDATLPERITAIESQLHLLASILPQLCQEELRQNRKIQSLALFQKLHTLLSSTGEFEKVISNILHFLTTELPFTHASITLSDLGKTYLSSPPPLPWEAINSKILPGLGEYALSIADLSRDFSLGSIPGITTCRKSLLAIPISASEGMTATITCYGSVGLELSSVEQDLLNVLKYRFKDIVVKHLQLESAQRSAVTDRMTGLFNRRYFNDRFAVELNEALGASITTSLIICDLDHFKELNDALGHQKGDHVLAEFGKILKQAIRRTDIACRYGGEEFAIILPKTPLADARAVAERIREATQSYDFGCQDRKVTVSLGLACCQNSSVDAVGMIKEADSALYRAKSGGRNRVESSLIVDKNMGSINVNDADELYVQKSSHNV